jgi:hypothetical protein
LQHIGAPSPEPSSRRVAAGGAHTTACAFRYSLAKLRRSGH